MSSSNLVRLTFIPEVTLGVTPGAGNFSTARFTSESLSGSPQTTESQQIRTDRLSSGQVVTGLEVGGDVNFELSKEAQIESFIESAMLSTWQTYAPVTVDLTIVAATRLMTRAAGDWNASVAVGDIITTSGFTNTVNNTQYQVIAINSATVIKVVANEQDGAIVDEVATGTSYDKADRISIGTTKKSFTMEKAFLDLTTKALNYKGMMVNEMNLDVEYGNIITGKFSFLGTKYENADAAAEFATFGRTIDSPATTNSMNGSIDMPFISTSLDGTFDEAPFCIQKVSIGLNNNKQPQTCIGETAPKDYSPGTAQIEISISAYLSNDDWDAISNKLAQTPFAIGFMVKNADGWYGFYLPAVQVSMDDPASGGANQQVSLEMSGTARVGTNGESSLYIYRG